MNFTKSKISLLNIIFLVFFTGNIFAQDVWTKIDENLFSLNKDALVAQLNEILIQKSIILEFPNTEGKLEAFEVKDHSVLPPALAIKYPNIHAYKGVSIYNENLIINFTLNSQNISATLMQSTNTWDLVNETKTNNYFVTNEKNPLNANYSCETIDDNTEVTLGTQSLKTSGLNSTSSNAQTFIGDNTLRILRTAITVSGGYSNYFINKFSLNSASEADQKAAVLGGIVASLNNINAVFERDLGVRLELIENNDELIFLNSNSDPFSSNDSNSLLNEGGDFITSTIGLNNFDIGHTLINEFAGLAAVSALCGTRKAQAVSGDPIPEGTNFDFTLFAHELGHQLGGTHTQNIQCERASNFSAVETGVGTTIMGYTGVFCDGFPQIQESSDDYFHYVSISQIRDHLQSSNCGIESRDVTNSNPVIEPLPNYTIPANTNFVLDAIATDVDGDNLTYTWEQIDGEEAEMPPVSTSTLGPLFRSFPPSSSSQRFFPQEFNTNTMWEVLPTVSREMNFSLTVRDGNAGGIASTNLTVNVVNTGEDFVITSPINGLRTPQNSLQAIEWNVAGTDANGINVENVKIDISYDSGETYETLFDSTPNDGREVFTVPNQTITNQARIRISAIDSIFFTIGESNFNITEELDDDLSFFKTPADKTLSIQVARLQVPTYTMHIYDMRGGEVFRTIIAGASEEIDISGLGTGFYVVKIIVGTQIYTRKLLKL